MVDKFKKQTFPIIILTIVLFLSSNLGYAKKWDVYPSMSRLEIQVVIDLAKNHDTINFHEGTYDFSTTSIQDSYANTGALIIDDKTLTIKGEQNTMFVGPDSIGYPSYEAKGISAFYVKDLDFNNNVRFENLHFKNFLRGVAIFYDSNYPEKPNKFEKNCKSVTIKNCVFTDIHSAAIELKNVRGNITIKNNELLVGDYFLSIGWNNWDSGSGYQDWQPKNCHIHIIENEIDQARHGMSISSTSKSIIKNNNIRNCIYCGIRHLGISKSSIISSNSIFNCKFGVALWGSWWKGLKYETKGAIVEQNIMNDITGMGVYIFGDECSMNIIRNNEINMAGYLGIYSESYNNVFEYNKITGSGWNAVYLSSGDYTSEGGSITYANLEKIYLNETQDFTSISSHYFLGEGTHDNEVTGLREENVCYIDNGYYNAIIDIFPCGGVSSLIKNSKTNQNTKFNFKKIKAEMKNQIKM